MDEGGFVAGHVLCCGYQLCRLSGYKSQGSLCCLSSGNLVRILLGHTLGNCGDGSDPSSFYIL